MKRLSIQKFCRLSFCAGLLFTCSPAFYPAPAQAQNVDSRLTRLEKEIETISRAVFRGETPPPGSSSAEQQDSGSVPAADLAVRIQQLETDLRDLTGKIEEQAFESRQFQEQTEKTLKTLEGRLSLLEDKTASGASPSSEGMTVSSPEKPPREFITGGGMTSAEPMPPQPGFEASGEETGAMDSTQDTPSVLGTLPSDPQAQPGTGGLTASPTEAGPVGTYEHAFALLRTRDYDAAEKGFRNFLDRYGDHELAANAQYWLGETLYARGDFKSASRVFAEGYQKYSKGPKGPDNLLKLGMSLAGMKKKDEACLTYKQLLKEYAAGAQAVLSRAQQEMKALGCP